MFFVKVHPNDNVATLLKDCKKGEILDHVILNMDINKGHKYALCDIPKGGYIIKYGEYIGMASEMITQGSHVHIHNIEGIRGRGDKE